LTCAEASVVSPNCPTNVKYLSSGCPFPARQPGLKNCAAMAQVEEKHIRPPCHVALSR
jgi:hypothetical protein